MTDDDRILSTARSIPFSPDEVYRAFASPELLATWWGPDGFTNSFELFEFKVGGRWKFVMHGPDGRDYPNESFFDALEPGRTVAIRHVCAPLFTLTVQLSPIPEGTWLTWEQAFESAEIAQAVKRIAGPANEQNLDRMTRALASARAS